MKREICCPTCAEHWRVSMRWTKGRTPGKFPGFNENGEGMRQVSGKADIGCTCDGCGKDIETGEAAVAVSIYSKGAPYFEWEGEFIDTSVTAVPDENQAAKAREKGEETI